MSEPLSAGSVADTLSREAQRARAKELVNRFFCRCDVDVHTKDSRFGVDIDVVKLGAVEVLDFRGSGVLEAHRRFRHIRDQGGEDIWFYLPRTARFRLSNGTEAHMLTPAQFGFVSDALPFSGCVYPGPDNTFAAWLVRLPASLFRPRLPVVDRYCHYPLTLDCASARVTAGLLDSLHAERETWSGAAAPLLGETLVHAIVAAGHDAITREDTRTIRRQDASRQRLLERVRQYVFARLGDPALDTLSIARDCGISVRSLHGLFDDTTTTVSAWIRAQRLERCREMLRDRNAAELSITEIAMACGFNDSAHFSKAYRRYFGVTPTADRRPSS